MQTHAPHEESEQQGATCQRRTNPSCTFHLHGVVWWIAISANPGRNGEETKPESTAAIYIFIYIYIYIYIPFEVTATEYQAPASTFATCLFFKALITCKGKKGRGGTDHSCIFFCGR